MTNFAVLYNFNLQTYSNNRRGYMWHTQIIYAYMSICYIYMFIYLCSIIRK